jgi:RNA polymerase sigma factor (sigma-70 family)
MKPQDREEDIQNVFDSYCKKIIRTKAANIHRQLKRRREREATFSELSPQELAKLAILDRYFTDEYVFTVLDENIGISNFELGQALDELPIDMRDIILMSYFFEMTDREIADKLNTARRTITDRRADTLQKLRKLLESEGLGE